jgi:hypothetical protein
LIGNRLIELVRVQDDAAEAVLQSSRTEFLIPTPSQQVRATIEYGRGREMERPSHAREAANASPTVVRAQWSEVLEVASQLDMAPDEVPENYDPALYSAVYARLLRHRHYRVLRIDEVLVPRGSAYELDIPINELHPAAEDVEQAMAVVESYEPERLAREVKEWYVV